MTSPDRFSTRGSFVSFLGKLARLTAAATLAMTLVGAAASPAEAQRYDRPRVRFGLSGVGGGFVGAAHGAFGGVSPRVGLQVNDVFAIYLQGQLLVGRFLPGPGDGLAGFAHHSLMFEFTASDVVQFGLGPSLDFVWGCTEVHQRACTGTGPYVGADARIAVLVGDRGPGRRSGLAISFDVHPTWFGDSASVALLLGIGYELY